MEAELNSETGETPELMESASAGIGDRLRAAREGKRLDLAHVSAETRIPERHLRAIEAGEFEALPSRTYAIGFSRTFARAVGLDEGEVANAVRDELTDGAERQASMIGAMEPGDPAKLPSRGLAWFGAIAALVLALGAFAFYSSYFGAGEGLGSLIAADEDEAAEAAEIVDEAAAQDEVVPTTPDASGAVVLTASEGEIWLRVTDGGERLYEGVLNAGDTYTVPASAQDPRINTARPDILAISIGGQDVPRLSDEQRMLSDAQISAAALLAREATPAG